MIIEYFEFPGYVWIWNTDLFCWSKRQKRPPVFEYEDRDFYGLSWHEILFETYKRYRNEFGWGDIYDAHENDDQDYFLMLDKYRRDV